MILPIALRDKIFKLLEIHHAMPLLGCKRYLYPCTIYVTYVYISARYMCLFMDYYTHGIFFLEHKKVSMDKWHTASFKYSLEKNNNRKKKYYNASNVKTLAFTFLCAFLCFIIDTRFYAFYSSSTRVV